MRAVACLVKPTLLVVIACLSLAAAGWGLGIYRQNSDHRRLYIDVWVPCVKDEETLEVLVSSRLRASEKSVVDRANEIFRHDSLNRLLKNPDVFPTIAVSSRARDGDARQ
jgi:hypothetical protein